VVLLRARSHSRAALRRSISDIAQLSFRLNDVGELLVPEREKAISEPYPAFCDTEEPRLPRVVNLIILDTRPLPQGCSAVSSPPGRSAREHLLYIQGYLAPASEARRSWVMADRNISRVINGVILRGTYSVKDGIVTVTTPIGSKSSQVVRGSKPGSLAYIMLGQLFYDVSSEPSDAPERPQ
jgi:hypothetical protein